MNNLFETRQQRYEAKRITVCNIKCVEGSSEHLEIERALKIATEKFKHSERKETFVSALLAYVK